MESDAPLRAADLPPRCNVADLLARNVATRPDEVALLSRERCVTFAELKAEADRFGRALRASGIGRGDVVAILMPDSIEWVAAFFGTLAIGGVALGLNTLLTAAEVAFMLADGAARAVVADESLQAKLPDRSDLRVIVDGTPRAGAIALRDFTAGHDGALDVETMAPGDRASLHYSSGTTGEPKGIPHEHKDHLLCAHNWGRLVLGLREGDRTAAGPKLFFSYGLGGNLIFPFYAGASAVLFRGAPRQAADFLDAVLPFRPTVLYHAPTGYAGMLALPDLARFDFASLRACVSAGEALPAPLFERWRAATGLSILDAIGSTENFHMFLSNRLDAIRPGSSGAPIPGVEARILDDEGREVAAGETGNLWVRSESAAREYVHRPELTAKTFRGEWMATGDKYRQDESGAFIHCGRSDDMLKVGGIYVSPMEVESALLAHAAVSECAVVGVADADGLVKPKAFVIVRPGVVADDALRRELIAHCAATMAEYKRPRQVEFVADLPKTATGKIQRFRLRKSR